MSTDFPCSFFLKQSVCNAEDDSLFDKQKFRLKVTINFKEYQKTLAFFADMLYTPFIHK